MKIIKYFVAFICYDARYRPGRGGWRSSVHNGHPGWLSINPFFILTTEFCFFTFFKIVGIHTFGGAGTGSKVANVMFLLYKY